MKKKEFKILNKQITMKMLKEKEVRVLLVKIRKNNLEQTVKTKVKIVK